MAEARSRRRPPAALGALLAVSTLLAVTWAAVLPAFQAPDEQAHFNYVQSLGARHTLPGDPKRPFFSTEVTQAITAVNSDQVAGQQPVKPEWNPQIEQRWAATQATAPRDDGGGAGPATAYPPTAYAWQAIGYAAASHGTLFDQLFAARLMSALWLPITVLGTWLLAGEVLGRRRLLQTAAAAVPALVPMVAFVSSSVSPDGMLFATWTLALWLGVRCVKRGVPLRDGAAFLAVVAVACTVKPTSYALLPAAALVVVLGVLARRSRPIPRRVAVAGMAVAGIAAIVGAAVFIAATQATATTGGVSATNWRELLSYVWQYYLPRLPMQQDYRIGSGGFPLLQVWITEGWGAFGWLEVKFEPWVYRVLGVLTVGIFAAALVALVRARRAIDWKVFSFLALAFISLVAGLHWTDFHQLEAESKSFMQGRYLFPVIGIIGLALAGAIALVPTRLRGAALGAAVAGLLVFHLFALGLILDRFYA